MLREGICLQFDPTDNTDFIFTESKESGSFDDKIVIYCNSKGVCLSTTYYISFTDMLYLMYKLSPVISDQILLLYIDILLLYAFRFPIFVWVVAMVTMALQL